MSYLESSGTSSLVDETWVAWFCSLSGNHVFCEVDKQFIEDTFNLFGLKQYISKDFNKVLYTILDRYDQEEAETEDLSRAAALLYGLIHARYIITTSGLSAMHKKYMSREFGECPRAYCNGQAVLPIGVTDEPRLGTYKLFCPRCRDLFNCSQTQRHIDGAYFGTTFPHIFLMSYEDLVPAPPTSSFVPRVFGFKIHPSSNSLPKAPEGGNENTTNMGANSESSNLGMGDIEGVGSANMLGLEEVEGMGGMGRVDGGSIAVSGVGASSAGVGLSGVELGTRTGSGTGTSRTGTGAETGAGGAGEVCEGREHGPSITNSEAKMGQEGGSFQNGMMEGEGEGEEEGKGRRNGNGGNGGDKGEERKLETGRKRSRNN